MGKFKINHRTILNQTIKRGGIILENIQQVIVQNLEPYNSIYNFIKTEIIPKYPCLTTVFQDNFDEEGNPRIQYYIKYYADLTLEEWHELRFKIIEDVKKFCISLGVSYEIYSEIDIILSVDGDYYEKYKKGF